MKAKQVYVIIVLMVMLGFVAGFSAPAWAKAKPIEIVFSTYMPTSYEYLVLPLKHFAEKVEKQSEGRLRFKFYHSGQLYKGKEEFAALERGDIDMTAPLDIYNTGIVPELGISNLPFMWSNPESLQRTLDAGLWDLGINGELLKHNMVVLGVAAGGPYQIYSKKHPVCTPRDMEGKKWGISGSTASKATELLGGAPTTMSSGELYLALQRGTIDGCTRPLITGLGRKLYEVVEHLSVTNMAYFCSFLAINKKKWDSLPEDVQEIMKKAAKERNQEQLHRLLAFMKKAIKLYQDKGVKVHIATQEELAKFKEKMAPVYDWWLTKVPDGKKYIEFAETHN
ncbi:MAG TPA: ABC transporter substrate-binding protein [Deltaproteobacteria bacterium]|nr:ABC transporter substrate-binding protein [Deltaproteobacteria bacterium]